MNKNASMSLEMIMKQLELDEDYMYLEQQRQEKLVAFRAAIKGLTEAQRDAIVDYIGIAEELHWYTMEIFCR